MLTTNQKIDLAAILGKIDVDLSFINDAKKEYIKQHIDLEAEALKLINTIFLESAPDRSIDNIKVAAQKYGVRKIVAVPYVDGVKRAVFFKVYGGDRMGFYLETGISLLKGICTERKSYIHDLIDEHGKVIYEKC